MDIEPKANYLDEWNELFAAISDESAEDYNLTYDKVTKYMFGNPTTLEDFITEALRMVPPVKIMTEISRSTTKRGNVIVKYLEPTPEKLRSQKGVHNTFKDPITSPIQTERVIQPATSDVSSSIDTTLKEQVKDLDAKLQSATQELRDSFEQLESNIPHNVSVAVQQAIAAAMQDAKAQSNDIIQQLNTTTNESQRKMDKLTGELRNATNKIESLHQRTTSLVNTTEETTDKAIKAYLEAKSDLDTATAGVKVLFDTEAEKFDENIRDFQQQVKQNVPTGTSQTGPSHQFRKSYPDEYTIDGNVVYIRAKKFQEDKTIITCESNDEVLTAYTLLEHIAQQYGICITPIEEIAQWDMNKAIPPTFPYDEFDFDNAEKFQKAYTAMSLALATKLRTAVMFGTKFMTAKLAISTYNNDGYVMLYHLIKNAHPMLQRNKATKPSKPTFQGDVNKYILQYTNWQKYQLTRPRPHVYDDDEIADDFLAAVKQDPWQTKLQKGIEYVESKLDRWKNSEDKFPHELKLQFIGHTLMTPYVENNENPLENTVQMPSIRTFQPRGRSRSNHRQRYPSQNRNSSRNRSTSSTRSKYRKCTICGGEHLMNTVGCPHLYRAFHLQNYMNSNNQSQIQRQVDMVDNARRERSASRESGRSRTSNQSSTQD